MLNLALIHFGAAIDCRFTWATHSHNLYTFRSMHSTVLIC